ncbi:amino acid adenylation domain-containing protein [Plectonema radiosum NIES-515]|uniref:Amino acid adenylation domain-containing protein n=1 Tax=Plectonema radiosum NIES-515 TaxID=2986073 RepID=A0ABT3B6H3_9CYAN|nr:amino acid adenylation domain-containing protein [Plectonema radiosum]MCV3216977.1 amino acid adenylation domain-containing protein [Plectonema radiosum NIES-515]
MVPATFVFLSKFPLTPSGKVDRRALPMPDLDRLDTRELVAPRTETEQTIAAIWREILQLEQVGIYENFFELGGHSLLATQVALRMQKAFQVDISVRTLFEQHTIAALANIVDTTTFKGIQSEHPIVRVSREREIFPSFAQERLWFLNQLEGANATYNIFDAWFLEGPLNITALEQSLTEIVRRHESLRTTFAAVKGQPTQIIHSTSTVKLEMVELLTLPEVEKQAQVQRWVAQESQYPFDLEHDSLLRVTLLRTAPEEHYLLLTIHHIVSDGWSMGIFMKELSALYKAFIKGEPVPLTALSLQYADFAHWQKGWLQGEVFSHQLNYWKAQLADAPPLLELPTDHPRPAVQSFQGASHSFTLPKGLSEQLKAFSSQSRTTLFMVLQAAFAILLHRYSAQEKILVGTPSANRNHLGIEPLIGFFVNMLVLRFNLSGNPTFNEFLFQVRQVALEAYSQQDLPFEQLVDVLQPKRSLSHSPLFQVAFGWQDSQFDSPNLFGLTVTRLEVEKVTAKFDLTLLMEEHEQGLKGEWEYSTDLFEPDTIQRMNGHFQTLLEGIVANPQQRVSSLPLLTEAERHQLLFEWNNTQTKYPQDKCIHELFEKQVELRPNAVAVIFEEEQLTYQELNVRANQLAHHLQTLGVGPEVLVGICVERSLSMVVGLLGILKAGGAYVPLDPAYPLERLALMLEDSAVPVLLTQTHLVEKLPRHQARVICLDSGWEEIALQSESNSTSEVKLSNLAYIIYTSGSTGKPKGVTVPHRAVNRLVLNTNYINLQPKDVVAFASNFSFDAVTFEIWGTLLNGARLVEVCKDMILSPENFADFIHSQEISVLFLTTALFNQIASVVPSAFRKVLHLLFGGEAVDTRWVKEVLKNGSPQRLLHVYGPTESTTFTSWYLVQDVAEGATTIPIGHPISNTRCFLLDAHKQPVPIGVPGELYIGGDGLARGYLNRPDLSLEKFVPNPFSEEPGSRLYKTGDLARYLPDGNIEFLSRVDNQVKLRGFRIELGEIEAVLSQHPQVLQAVVIMREDKAANKYLAAYLVPKLEVAAPPKSSELRSFLKAKLADYMVPGTFVFLEAMPLTPNGKVDRSALPAPDSANFTVSTLFVPPQSPLEEDLVNIWREVLGIEQIGTHDDFFTLGGHSLLATQIISRVRELFQVALPLRSLFENPTVAGLAQRLDTLQKAKDVFVTSEVVSLFPNVEDDEEGEL